jgi:hypothetical protein
MSVILFNLYEADNITPATKKRHTVKQESFKKKLWRRRPAGSMECEICNETGALFEAAHIYDLRRQGELEMQHFNDGTIDR